MFTTKWRIWHSVPFERESLSAERRSRSVWRDVSFRQKRRRCVIMHNLLRCFQDAGSVTYISKLPSPSLSAPCILHILTHLKGCAKTERFDTPPFLCDYSALSVIWPLLFELLRPEPLLSFSSSGCMQWEMQ